MRSVNGERVQLVLVEIIRFALLNEVRFPHSLGMLYSAFTYYTGFKVNSGEYKLMGLAPYGNPTYVEVILDKLVDIRDDGSLWLDMTYFNYCQGLTMTSEKFHQLFGGPPRKPESLITQKDIVSCRLDSDCLRTGGDECGETRS
jgi:carbamoyltransferase